VITGEFRHFDVIELVGPTDEIGVLETNVDKVEFIRGELPLS